LHSDNELQQLQVVLGHRQIALTINAYGDILSGEILNAATVKAKAPLSRLNSL
jgi:hypothetical protein